MSARHQVGPPSLHHQFLLLLVNDLAAGGIPSFPRSNFFSFLPRLLSAQLISCCRRRRRRRLKRRTPSIISKLRAAFLSPPLLTFYCFWAELEKISTRNRNWLGSGLNSERKFGSGAVSTLVFRLQKFSCQCGVVLRCNNSSFHQVV